ncbi:MAG: NUDIX hydrolase [Ktedonobacterales bacterium]
MKRAPAALSGDNPDEIFDLIDLDDQVIGKVRRGDAHRDPGLVHRSVQVLVFDSSARVLLQRRSATKDLFPGYYCASASGHVAAGEDYADTALRETEEELGQALLLAYICKELVRSTCETEMTALFLGRSDGPFTFHPIETDGGDFFPLADLESYRTGLVVPAIPMTPALLAALDEIFRLRREGLLDRLLPEL